MPVSLIDKLRDIPLVFVDVETTGASTDYGDRVMEIGIVRVEGGGAVCGGRAIEYQQLIDPQRRISAGVVALTGITQAMVSGQPKFADVLPRVVELMSGAVVIGHNVRFDLSFLHGEFRRCSRSRELVIAPEIAPRGSVGLGDATETSHPTAGFRPRLLHEHLGNVHVMDTVRIARRRFGRGGNGLQRLAPRLGVVPTAAHRALADAVTTAGVFERMLEPLGCWDLCLCDAIAQQGGPMGLLPASPRESLLPLELQEALEQGGRVMMEYVDGDDRRTQRVIEPLQIRRFKGELTLVAHCHLRNDRRTFKLERIVHLTKIEPPATSALAAGSGTDAVRVRTATSQLRSAKPTAEPWVFDWAEQKHGYNPAPMASPLPDVPRGSGNHPITLVVITARDLAASGAFYAKIFGWQMMPMSAELTAFSAPGSGPFGALRSNLPAGFPGMVAYIGVGDIDAMLKQIVSAGGSVEKSPWNVPMVGKLARFKDAGGTIWGLMSGATPMGVPPPVPMPFGDNPRPPAGSICHIEMHAAGDGSASAKFFEQMFGWGTLPTMPQFIAFDPGAGITGIFQTHTPTTPAMTYVYTEDVEQKLAEIERAGGQRDGNPIRVPGMGCFGYFKDVSGTELGLIGP
jgi:DNA polymerase-3 subunit epsilon